MRDRYKIGGEHKFASLFAVFYFALGLLFADLKVSIIITAFFVMVILLERFGFEAPLAIFIRTVHIIFVALVILSAIKAI